MKKTNSSLSEIYGKHNLKSRGEYFCIYEKERADFILSVINSQSEILDIGCRDGALTKYVLPGNQVTGCDVDAAALKRAKKLGISNTISMDLNGNWSELAGKKYDYIMAFEILEHLYYPDQVLSKITKHLRAGGTLIGSVPNGFSAVNRLKLFMGNKKGTSLDDPTHISHFSHDELEKLFLRHFKHVKILPLINQQYMWLARLNPALFSYMFMFECELS